MSFHDPSTPTDTFLVDTSIQHDGGLLHYRLEGNPSPSSPVLVFISDALMNFHIWDPTIRLLKQRQPRYRFLRYDLRGYSSDSIGNAKEFTLELLSDDLRTLLSHLQIQRAHSIIAMGLGAHVVLSLFARQPPEQQPSFFVSSFVGVSFAIPRSPSQSIEKIKYEWSNRVNIARRVGGNATTANKAASRWFTADSRGSPEWQRVREIVAQADVDGMEKVGAAVIERVGSDPKCYDGKETLRRIDVPTLFICGAGDFVLPEDMEGYPALMTEGLAKYVMISRASKLACCERVEDFVGSLETWLNEVVEQTEK